MNKDILLFILFISIGQISVWFQLNGQFIWKWFEKNTLLLSLLGIPISYFFIEATRLGYRAFNGLLWPQRFLAFSLGIVVFTFCTWFFLGESISNKTFLSLVLAFTLVLIQIFWK